MHAFIASRPAYFLLPGAVAAPATVVVCCQYDTIRRCFSAWVGSPSGRAVQQCERLTLTSLLHWLREAGIHWPGGLPTALGQDAQAPPGSPGRLVYWREQGPEVMGLFDIAKTS